MGLLESGMLLFWPFIVVILIVGLLSFFTVQTAQVAVITRFGKFLRVAEPGLNWKWPLSTGSPAGSVCESIRSR